MIDPIARGALLADLRTLASVGCHRCGRPVERFTAAHVRNDLYEMEACCHGSVDRVTVTHDELTSHVEALRLGDGIVAFVEFHDRPAGSVMLRELAVVDVADTP